MDPFLWVAAALCCIHGAFFAIRGRDAVSRLYGLLTGTLPAIIIVLVAG